MERTYECDFIYYFNMYVAISEAFIKIENILIALKYIDTKFSFYIPQNKKFTTSYQT